MIVGRVEPFLTHNFVVLIEGVPVAGFMEVSAIAVETEVEKIRVGGMNQSEVSLLGPTKYSDVTLKQGMASSRDLFVWHEAVIRGYGVRANIHIVAYDSNHLPRATWTLIEAIPIKWVGPALKASSSEIAISEITFTHSGILRLV